MQHAHITRTRRCLCNLTDDTAHFAAEALDNKLLLMTDEAVRHSEAAFINAQTKAGVDM